MTITVETLTPDMEASYETFLKTLPTSLLFHSVKYKELLKRYTGAHDQYLIARNENKEITGALPLFILEGPQGKIVNSLPFYGSNGGVLLKNREDSSTKNALLSAYTTLVSDQNAAAATLITNPMDDDPQWYKDHLQHNFTEERIGQITTLPALTSDNQEEQSETLLAFLHKKTRNMVRKAMKLDIRICKQKDDEAIAFLYETHRDNMERIGGKAKSKSFFELIPEIFTRGEDYEILTAFYEDEPVAALLLFHYNQTVEYFTPVIVHEHRSTQALSLLIFESMRDAAQKQYSWWNWGGTWLSQEGVYQFKKSWEAKDYPYFYYISLFNRGLLQQTPQELLTNYPFFYTVPFTALQSSSKEKAS